jgi:hypothetical protein
MLGSKPFESVDEKLAQYERNIADTRKRNAAARRVKGTAPSHPLRDYVGTYAHSGYGKIEIIKSGDDLIFQRYERDSLILPLEHWHYDAWVAKENDTFGLHEPNPFDATDPLLFGTNTDGDISNVALHLEPAVAPICFQKQ